ncbi:G-protein alpha subunit [Mycena sanguinolenta]|uniref:G-protein alpha subunit n=1 Tax=Mycena sanguinolenta TaxID=230812 RepID=A0A8H7DKP3_9AGAR|nr:G-protein alpha subunit [Mycena sanguinolenta]
MGCVNSTGVDEKAKARNDEIENQLKRDSMLARNEIKMLLLGARESGKSTILKQMKLTHLDGYNAQERDAHKEIIYSNTIQSMRAILEAMPQLDISLHPSNDARRATIMALPPRIDADVLPRDLADAVKGLWRDPGVKEAVRRSREFQLNDNAVYYFSSIDRMAAPEYLPTDQDIWRSRVKTTGIMERRRSSPALNTPRTLHHTIFLEYVHVFDDVGYYVAAVQCPPRLPLFILSPSGARRALYLRHPPRLFNASHATFSPRRSLNT